MSNRADVKVITPVFERRDKPILPKRRNEFTLRIHDLDEFDVQFASSLLHAISVTLAES